MELNVCMGDFREIPKNTQKKLNGGSWAILAGFLIAVTVEVMSDWDNFKNGLMGRPEEK